MTASPIQFSVRELPADWKLRKACGAAAHTTRRSIGLSPIFDSRAHCAGLPLPRDAPQPASREFHAATASFSAAAAGRAAATEACARSARGVMQRGASRCAHCIVSSALTAMPFPSASNALNEPYFYPVPITFRFACHSHFATAPLITSNRFLVSFPRLLLYFCILRVIYSVLIGGMCAPTDFWKCSA